jgi:hypothetical protein
MSVCLLSCNRVAASCMQIVPAWPPVACIVLPILFMLHATGGHVGTICMLLATTGVQFICDWWPLRYNLYLTGHQSHANFACAGCQLHAKPPVFCKHAARTVIRIKKMKTTLKNLRIYATHVLAKAYPLTLCMARSNLLRQFL